MITRPLLVAAMLFVAACGSWEPPPPLVAVEPDIYQGAVSLVKSKVYNRATGIHTGHDRWIHGDAWESLSVVDSALLAEGREGCVEVSGLESLRRRDVGDRSLVMIIDSRDSRIPQSQPGSWDAWGRDVPPFGPGDAIRLQGSDGDGIVFPEALRIRGIDTSLPEQVGVRWNSSSEAGLSVIARVAGEERAVVCVFEDDGVGVVPVSSADPLSLSLSRQAREDQQWFDEDWSLVGVSVVSRVLAD